MSPFLATLATIAQFEDPFYLDLQWGTHRVDSIEVRRDPGHLGKYKLFQHRPHGFQYLVYAGDGNEILKVLPEVTSGEV